MNEPRTTIAGQWEEGAVVMSDEQVRLNMVADNAAAGVTRLADLAEAQRIRIEGLEKQIAAVTLENQRLEGRYNSISLDLQDAIEVVGKKDQLLREMERAYREIRSVNVPFPEQKNSTIKECAFKLSEVIRILNTLLDT